MIDPALGLKPAGSQRPSGTPLPCLALSFRAYPAKTPRLQGAVTARFAPPTREFSFAVSRSIGECRMPLCLAMVVSTRPHGSGGGHSTVNSRMFASGRYTVFRRGVWDSSLPLEKSIVSTPFSTWWRDESR